MTPDEGVGKMRELCESQEKRNSALEHKGFDFSYVTPMEWIKDFEALFEGWRGL